MNKIFYNSVLKTSWGMLEYAMKNGAFCLKNLILSTNDFKKCFLDQIQGY